MKLAIGYSSKDQAEITEQTIQRLRPHFNLFRLYWADASETDEGIAIWRKYCSDAQFGGHVGARVLGGPDAAIAWKLSKCLATDATHIGLLENDVLLDEDWFEPTMELFEKGKADGLEVGGVSARSYGDRVLIQREGYAVMHNLGAGMVIFTRDAAETVLRSFRTHWWPTNRVLFAQLSGIDLATYAAFKGGDHFVSTDWGFDAQLASHGLASLALTPAKCQMIGQKWPLEQQGLKLTTQEDANNKHAENFFETYRDNLAAIRIGQQVSEIPGLLHRQDRGMLFFAHQIGFLPGATWQGTLELAWYQGFGPFGYRAGPGGASLSVPISGFSQFHVNGGVVVIEDSRSGFKTSPDLTAVTEAPVIINVYGGPIKRVIHMRLEEGAIFYGLSTGDPQVIDPSFKFEWAQLPEAR